MILWDYIFVCSNCVGTTYNLLWLFYGQWVMDIFISFTEFKG